MHILVINAGSSSIKASLFDADKLGESNVLPLWKASLLFTAGKNAELSVGDDLRNINCGSYTAGLSIVLKALPESEKIDVVGHRVVHGGNYYSDSVAVDDKVIDNLKQCIELAPEHQLANLEGIAAARKHFPQALQIAVFDTAFHQSMPESAKALPGPYEWYEKQGIRRFGFHGISHKYCAARAVEILCGGGTSGRGDGNAGKKSIERMITCHLGAGASLCAIKNGASIMTTMSFTPLDGLIMKTRSGSIDPGVMFHLLRKGIYTADELDRVLNGESGLKGISGLSGDMRELLQAACVSGSESGNNVTNSSIGTKQRAQLALEMLVDSVAGNIAALIPRLGGLDALVFTAGIGENSPEIRSMICKRLSFIGVQLDEKQNTNPATTKADKLISAPDSKIHCLVIHTREDLLIARECERLNTKR